jgi:hypothetical protein
MKHAACIGLLIVALCVVSSAQEEKIDCPTISITGPAEITNPGDVMVFRADVKGTVPSGSKFQWTVSSGIVEGGQGTRSITVRTSTGPTELNIAATLKLTGLPNTCLVSATEIASIMSLPIGEPVDRYGQISLFDEYARIQNGITAAKDNPTSLLVMIRESPRFGSAERVRLSKIKAFISQRLHFSLGKLRIITNISPQTQNTIWLVPPGAKMPE